MTSMGHQEDPYGTWVKGCFVELAYELLHFAELYIEG